MSFDKQAAAARFGRKTYESGCGEIFIRKPKVRAYAGFLDVVRKCVSAQKAAGDGAVFDPEGVTDLELCRIVAVDDDGAPVFDSVAEVEAMLSCQEIIEVATLANEMIHPTANPTTAPAQS